MRHGKIIDNANSPEKETTQRLSLVGLTTRFQIREEEFELTYLRSVRLELALADGRSVEIVPRWGDLASTPGDFQTIKYDQARSYDFELPENVRESDVVSSTLAVTGYYLRYSSLIAATADKERKAMSVR